jgi:hypothetical protein
MPQEIIQQSPLPSTVHRIRESNELAKVIDSSQEVLARAKTVFPLDLFPDTVTVDRSQVTITHHWFFFVGATSSIRIEDILNVEATVGPFFGSLTLSTRYFDSSRAHNIKRLWRWDAVRLQAIIQGMIVAAKKQIDTMALNKNELIDGLTKVGQTPGDAL